MKLYASKFVPGDVVLFRYQGGPQDQVVMAKVETLRWFIEKEEWLVIVEGFTGGFKEDELCLYNTKTFGPLPEGTRFEIDI